MCVINFKKMCLTKESVFYLAKEKIVFKLAKAACKLLLQKKCAFIVMFILVVANIC